MPAFCGFDFGTSNSTIGVGKDSLCQLVMLENNKPTIRSAIFCDTELKEWIFGQEGVNSYLEGVPGRLMMSLKSVLGSSLMEDKTVIFNEYIPYSSVLARFMQHVKQHAEQSIHSELTHVVLGRPVHFDDNDAKKDRLAQNTLEKIARDIGFKEVSFQFEPIAAAMTYEMLIKQEQLALIVDMGGGTSDFTIIRLHPGAAPVNRYQDVLANCGIHIAGTDFDQRLSLNVVMPLLGLGSMMSGSSSDIEVPSMFYHDLTTWHTLSNLYDAKTLTHIRSIRARAYQKNLLDRLLHVLKTKAAHHILDTVETSKQRLSDELEVNLNLDFIEHNLEVLLQRQELNAVIQEDLEKIIATIEDAVKISEVKFTDINAIFYTGGSTKIPLIRDRITALFPQAKVVQGDAFGSVGLGLTLEAQRKYR